MQNNFRISFIWVSVGCARSQACITLCIVRFFTCAHLTYLFMPTKIQLIKTLRLIRPNLISTTSFGMCVTVNFKRNYFFCTINLKMKKVYIFGSSCHNYYTGMNSQFHRVVRNISQVEDKKTRSLSAAAVLTTEHLSCL